MARHSVKMDIHVLLTLLISGLTFLLPMTASAILFKDLAVDKEGRVYAATWEGIHVYDQDGKRSGHYTKVDGLPTNVLTSVCLAPDGAVWFGSTHGVIRLKDGLITTFTVHEGLNHNLTYTVAYSPSLGLLAGTERGVCRLVDNRFVPLDDEHEFARRRVYDIHIDREGTAWFAKEAGLSRYANENDRTVFRRDVLQFPVESGPVRNEIFCVTTDQHNRPWVGTRSGISYFNGHRWRNFVDSQSDPVGLHRLLNPYVTTLCFDREGKLWIGHGNSESDGMTVMKDGLCRHVRVGDDFKAGSVYKIRSYGSRIWLATSNGIFSYTDGKFARFGRHETDTTPHDDVKRN